MKKRVILIHTSMVFFNRETILFDLFDKIIPDVEKYNIVDDLMLKEVMESNKITPQIIKRMVLYVQSAESMQADAIFNTCSSLGPAFDIAKETVQIPCVKIDDAMTEKAAKSGERIAILATVPTTLPPTADLVYKKSNELKKTIEVKKYLAEGAFELLMDGNIKKHDSTVSETAKNAAKWADTIVLAQCSMARLESRLSEETNLPVFSSPELGIDHLKHIIYQK